METTAITETYLTLFSNLLVALAIGFLIGLERGWSKRELEPGRRIAGIRTFGLISLLGGLTMLLGRESSIWVIALAFGGLGLLVASAAFIEAQRTGEYGITTEVAAFIAFILGGIGHDPPCQISRGDRRDYRNYIGNQAAFTPMGAKTGTGRNLCGF